MRFNLNYLLNLPGVMVETCAEVEEMISLKLEILVEEMNCPHCQKYTEELHQMGLNGFYLRLLNPS